jgi:hypothetical protein
MTKKIRQGFLKQEIKPEWSIDNNYLYWKNPALKKIHLDSLRPQIFLEYDLAKKYSSMKMDKSAQLKDDFHYPEKLAINATDLSDARKQLLEKCRLYEDPEKPPPIMKPAEYLWYAPAILKNKKWSDAEKMYFIALGYCSLSGFHYGAEAQRWLEQITWSEKSARNRMREYFEYLRVHKLHDITCISHDEAHFQKLPSTIKIYRGFNVPMNSIIRAGTINKLWLKQQTGKSVYFSTSLTVAEKFACSQKLYQVQNHRKGETLSRQDRDILEGRLCVAQYQVNLDDIALFQDKTAMNEEEIIVSAEKVQLLSYHFMGGDDFERVLSR